jgi:hypothetical protein
MIGDEWQLPDRCDATRGKRMMRSAGSKTATTAKLVKRRLWTDFE